MLFSFLLLSSAVAVLAAPQHQSKHEDGDWTQYAGAGGKWGKSTSQAAATSAEVNPPVVSTAAIQSTYVSDPAPTTFVTASTSTPLADDSASTYEASTYATNTQSAEPAPSAATSVDLSQTQTPDGSLTPTLAAADCPGQQIEIENNSGTPIWITATGQYQTNGCDYLEDGESCHSCQAWDTSGAFSIGLTTPNGDEHNTLIEGNSNPKDTCAAGTLDISIVDGYSVPIMCGAVGSPIAETGFSTALCDDIDCSNCKGATNGEWSAKDRFCKNYAGTNVALASWSDLPFFETVGLTTYYYPNQPLSYPSCQHAWLNSKCVTYAPVKGT